MKKKKSVKRKPQPSRRFRLILSVVAALILLPAAVWLYSYLTLSAPDLPPPPLKDLAAQHNIGLGMHILDHRLADKPYAELVKSQYHFVTSDAEAHWVHLRPSKDKYDYSRQDKLMAFAKQNNMPMQIHHLVWGEETWLPQWLRKSNYSKEEYLKMIHDHIFEVAGHYKGQVAEWTVVNETFTRAVHRYNLDDFWADRLGGGTDYIDKAFIWAHEADPNAKLIFNDFDTEVQNSISDKVYQYIKEAKARGVPIHGLGMQMHLSGANPPKKADVIKNMQRFKAIGVDVYVTEFDVNINRVKGDAAHKRQVEAQVTYDMVRACVESKACAKFSAFGVSDKNDRIKRLMRTDSHSFIFDSRYRPKPSFYSFYNALQEK